MFAVKLSPVVMPPKEKALEIIIEYLCITRETIIFITLLG